MQLHEIRKALHGEAYDFLRTNPHLGSRVRKLLIWTFGAVPY